MGQITKNIPEPKENPQNIPESLIRIKQNYQNARYNYTYDPKEIKYINYNTLRNKRANTEVLDLVKVYRLLDRDTEKEYVVWYQNSKVKDFNNNLVPCPIDERYGLVDRPETNEIVDPTDEISDIQLIETQNDFYIEFDKEEVAKLFKKTRQPQKVACYVGYAKPMKNLTNDFIESKRQIRNQNAFLTDPIDNLINISDKDNIKETFNIKKIQNRSAGK